MFKRKVIVRGLGQGEYETGIMCTDVIMGLYLYVMYKTNKTKINRNNKTKNSYLFLMVKATVQNTYMTWAK